MSINLERHPGTESSAPVRTCPPNIRQLRDTQDISWTTGGHLVDISRTLGGQMLHFWIGMESSYLHRSLSLRSHSNLCELYNSKRQQVGGHGRRGVEPINDNILLLGECSFCDGHVTDGDVLGVMFDRDVESCSKCWLIKTREGCSSICGLELCEGS